MDQLEQIVAERFDSPVIAGGEPLGRTLLDLPAWAVLVDAQPAAVMAFAQAEAGAMGAKDHVGSLDGGTETRHGCRIPC